MISGRVYSVGGSFLYGSELEVPDPVPLKARASEGNKMGTDLALWYEGLWHLVISLMRREGLMLPLPPLLSPDFPYLVWPLWHPSDPSWIGWGWGDIKQLSTVVWSPI